MARASGGANNMRPLSWWGTSGKDAIFNIIIVAEEQSQL